MNQLSQGFSVLGLSRSSAKTENSRPCDLFSLKESDEALAGADVGIYLIHSMLPTAKLTQARFENLDVIAADNFARSAKKNGLKQIIYLGGLVPEQSTSRHLASRYEVERVLASHGVPLTSFRCGLILGPGGSSFQMLQRLVERLPAMILPSWTQTKTQPVDLQDVIQVIVGSILRPDFYHQSFDLGCDRAVSYEEMIKKTAEMLGLKRMFFRVPIFTPRLSSLWVALMTGAPFALVSPLVESLKYSLLARNHEAYLKLGLQPRSFEESLRAALRSEGSRDRLKEMRVRNQVVASRNEVRSVQRLSLPAGFRAQNVAEEYLVWVQRLFKYLIKVKPLTTDRICFQFLSLGLLILELDRERSSPDRFLLRIRGGLLAQTEGRGRLEFRELLGGEFVIAAIHDYRPRLPWFIYRWTQARLHLWVMNRFEKHLKSLSG